MVRFTGLFLACLLAVLACADQQQGSSSAQIDSASLSEEIPKSPADTLDNSSETLLDYSPMDTCDGVFEGSYEEEHGEITVRATVLVHLQDCRVTEITLLDSTSLNSEAIAVIPQRIIETQMLPVEAVSGASVSSWTIMTATALALGIDLLDIE